jgi:2-iminobutanoate/2-iminopropanoate deaminase
MKREVIRTSDAPKAIGPYSQAIRIDSLIYTAGAVPINPRSGRIEAPNLAGQVRQSLENLNTILEAAGSSLQNVVKFTVFMLNLNDFAELNRVFQEYFRENYPARSAVQVSRLPLDSLVEIEAVAIVNEE